MAGLAKLSVEDIAGYCAGDSLSDASVKTSLDNWKSRSALNWIVKEVNREETAVKMKMMTG